MRGIARRDGAGSAGLRRWPRLLLLYCVICPPAAFLVVTAYCPMWSGRPLLALGNTVLSMALLCAGILLLDEPSQRSSAGMLLGASVLLTCGWLNVWETGPLPLISVLASPAGTILAAWAMFCYPSSPHEPRAGNRFFTVILVCFLLGEVCCIVTSRPEWAGFDFAASAWWPAWFPSQSFTAAAQVGLDIAGITFTFAYMLLWGARWRRARGISRSLALPVAVAASVNGAITVVELVADMVSASPDVMNIVYTVEAYLQIGVPAAFVVSIMRRRFARTRIADLLLRLRGPSRAASITDALRDVFEDPLLDVVGWAPGVNQGSDPVNQGRAHPPPAGDRLCLPVDTSSGERLAVILADPSLSAKDDLVTSAVAASCFVLENARLEAVLADQLREVRDSRLRIIQAGMAERRRLERDLHDGTQQRLLALKIMLAAAESEVSGSQAGTIINRVRSELGVVIEELRNLAHGIHPAVLSQVGLEQAIRSLAERYTIPIDVDLPPARFDEAAELTAYYVIAESVTNAIKHASASRISIRGSKSGGWLRISIADDGRGGASAAAGTGIHGLIDRARGVGGDVEIDSPPGEGTRIRAVIPCG